MQNKIFMITLTLILSASVSFAYGKKDQAAEAPAAVVEAVAALETAVAPAEQTAASGMPAMTEEQMKKMQEMTSPNEHHAVLNPMAGSWKTTSNWWQSADAQPEVSQGTSEFEWILGGRFLEHEYHGTSMGQPFEGKGILGYDNVKGEYTSIWLDNMLTGIMTSSSQYDAAAKTFAEQGTMACPMTGEKEKKYRAVTTMVDDDHFTYAMYSTGMAGTGDEFKVMEISYERVK